MNAAIAITWFIVALLALCGGSLAYWLLRWRVQRNSKTMLAEMASGTYRVPEMPKHQPRPGDSFLVHLDDIGVTCTHPDGVVERMKWADLVRITWICNNHGSDVLDLWELTGTHSQCLIPMGATGGHELTSKLLILADTDDGAFVEAMSSAANQPVVFWEKGDDGC